MARRDHLFRLQCAPIIGSNSPQSSQNLFRTQALIAFVCSVFLYIYPDSPGPCLFLLLPGQGYFADPQNGILGIIVIALGFVIWWQQRRIDKKEDLIETLQKELGAAADSYTKNYIETVKEVVTTQKDTTSALNLLQRSIDSLTSGFQSFINRRGKP